MSDKDLFGQRIMSMQTIEAIGKYLSLVEKFKVTHSFDPYTTKVIKRNFERMWSMEYVGDKVELKFTVEVGDRKVYTRRYAVVNDRMVTVKQLTDILHKHKYEIE